MTVARGRRLGADRTSRKGQPEVLPGGTFSRPLEDGRRLAAGASWPQLLPTVGVCLLSTAVCAVDDKYDRQRARAALPCCRVCRYVAGGAAWFGGVFGRLRANTPVYGSFRLLFWPL